jgi:hypothetical protein
MRAERVVPAQDAMAGGVSVPDGLPAQWGQSLGAVVPHEALQKSTAPRGRSVSRILGALL